MTTHTMSRHEECWNCGKTLRAKDLIVTTQLERVSKDGVHFHALKGQLYNLACLNCAAQYRINGINLGNLASCAPKGWTRQVSTEMLQKLYNDEYPGGAFGQAEYGNWPSRRFIVRHIQRHHR